MHLSILDIQGRLVMEFGHVQDSVRWDGIGRIGTRVAAGMYVVVARTGDRRASKKIFVLK